MHDLLQYQYQHPYAALELELVLVVRTDLFKNDHTCLLLAIVYHPQVLVLVLVVRTRVEIYSATNFTRGGTS